jgi:hypothetical protein
MLVQINTLTDLYKAGRISAILDKNNKGRMPKFIMKFGCY